MTNAERDACAKLLTRIASQLELAIPLADESAMRRPPHERMAWARGHLESHTKEAVHAMRAVIAGYLTPKGTK